jgi:hypothetical protein
MRGKSRQSQIFQIINGLTSDEDYRQELWCHYLSGDSSAMLSDRLTKIKQDSENYDRLQEAIWVLYKNPPSPELLDFLRSFSEFEQSIMFLLLMGFSANEVSEYKDISLVRIRQIIVAIQNNPVWEDRWHLNETLQTKNDTD